ncbi:helix-turn-helix domain-containing protein [Lentzea sp. NPDC092896]|uniref:helix-turn-helix domain-containing protein n=1 Tax=Lentzea sp. NPDC092896 TaxID=3364127 RepID=UPI0037F93216
MPKRFSTAKGREFGASLREAIKNTGYTSRELAEVLDWDESKLSNVANGKGGVAEVDFAVLLGICRLDAVERRHLQRLYLATGERNWLQQHGACPPAYPRTLAESLAMADTAITWHPHGFPALLQVSGHVRAEIASSSTIPRQELDDRIAARLKLQEQWLQRYNLTCMFYLHELALALPVGGDDVHAEQLHHLLQLAVRPRISIRIIPTAFGAHAGMRGPFTRLTFNDHEPLVCVENENSTLFLEDKAAVEGYGKVVQALGRSSLDCEESKAMIVKLGERLSARSMSADG